MKRAFILLLVVVLLAILAVPVASLDAQASASEGELPGGPSAPTLLQREQILTGVVRLLEQETDTSVDLGVLQLERGSEAESAELAEIRPRGLPFYEDFEGDIAGWWPVPLTDAYWRLITNPDAVAVRGPVGGSGRCDGTTVNDINPDLVTFPDAPPGSGLPAYLPEAHSGRRVVWFGGGMDIGSYLNASAHFNADMQTCGNGGITDPHGVPNLNQFGLGGSPIIDLASAENAAMSYWTWWEVEGSRSRLRDFMLVTAIDLTEFLPCSVAVINLLAPPDGCQGSPDLNWSSGGCNSAPQWTQQFLDLGACTGKPIALAFLFAASDAWANGFRGWAIDDVRIDPVPAYSISGTVFEDMTRDGVPDADEPGYGGVTVNLLDPGADGLCSADDVATANASTDAEGGYSFEGLDYGQYCVHVSDVANVLEGRVLSTATSPTGPLVIGSPGAYHPGVDFGYTAEPDLIVSLAVDSAYAHRHDPVLFTVTVQNRGTVSAADVTVAGEISEYLEKVQVNATQGSVAWNGVTRLVKGDLGSLDAGDSAELMIDAQVGDISAASLPVTVRQTVELDYANSPSPQVAQAELQVGYFVPGEVPEPATLLLLGSGLVGLAGYGWRGYRRRPRED